MIAPQDAFTSARTQAGVVMVGLMTVVCVGVAGCIALVMALFYIVVSFVLIVLQAISEVYYSFASLWVHADPLLKVLLLGVVAYGLYRFYRSRAKKRGAHDAS